MTKDEREDIRSWWYHARPIDVVGCRGYEDVKALLAHADQMDERVAELKEVLRNIIAVIRMHRKGSMGSLYNVYEGAIDVKSVERWEQSLKE